MVAFARNTNVPAPVRGGSRVAAGTRNGVFRDGQYESRLVGLESLPSVPDAAKLKVENVYDYMGRRVSKTVSSDYSGGAYAVTNVTTFVYDGWLSVAEVTDEGGLVSTNLNVWGLDLSGSSQGAGGVGGLLATIQDNESYFTCMDGNGNVCQYVDANGTVVAHREYDPFGGTVALVGAKKNDFAAWFSTKPLDRETGLYAYTFRYYDPETGRWPSRDRIGEDGGRNIYGFVANNPLSWMDALGLLKAKVVLEDWSDDRRQKLFSRYVKRYGPTVRRKAEKHCVPYELLFAVVANEMIDTTWWESHVFDGMTVGLAQLEVSGAIEDGLVDVNPNRVRLLAFTTGEPYQNALYRYARAKLESTDGSIEAAARRMKKLLRGMCDIAKTESYSQSFYYAVAGGCKLDDFCCLNAAGPEEKGSSCQAVVSLDVPACLISTMGALWNSGLSIASTPDVFDDAHDEVIINGQNAYWLDDVFLLSAPLGDE